jgi:hypothetical protein
MEAGRGVVEAAFAVLDEVREQEPAQLPSPGGWPQGDSPLTGTRLAASPRPVLASESCRHSM